MPWTPLSSPSAWRLLPLLALLLGSCRSVQSRYEIGIIPVTGFAQEVNHAETVLIMPTVRRSVGLSVADTEALNLNIADQLTSACQAIELDAKPRGDFMKAVEELLVDGVMQPELYARAAEIGKMNGAQFLVISELDLTLENSTPQPTTHSKNYIRYELEVSGRLALTLSLVDVESATLKYFETLSSEDTISLGKSARLQPGSDCPPVSFSRLEDSLTKQLKKKLREEIVGREGETTPVYCGESATEFSLFGLMPVRLGDLFTFEGDQAVDDGVQELKNGRFLRAQTAIAQGLEALQEKGAPDTLLARIHHTLAVAFLAQAAGELESSTVEETRALVAQAMEHVDLALDHNNTLGASQKLRETYKPAAD